MKQYIHHNLMKRAMVTILSFLGSIVCHNVFALSVPRPIVLNMDDRPPFHYLDTTTKKMTGETYHIVKCTLDTIQVNHEILILPWQRAQQNTQNGAADGFFAASQNSTRDKYATQSAIIAPQYWNWYFLTSNKKRLLDPYSNQFKKNVSLSSWHGSNSLKWLNGNEYQIAETPYNGNDLVNLLYQKRVDAIFGSNYLIQSAVQDHHMSLPITEVKGPYKPMGVYFSNTFLKGNPEFLKAFNKTVSTCQKQVLEQQKQ